MIVLRRFKAGFANFNIEFGDYMIVLGQFKSGFGKFYIESDECKTVSSGLKIEIRQLKTV